jgi:hypothetical protein
MRNAPNFVLRSRVALVGVAVLAIDTEAMTDVESVTLGVVVAIV